jgi:hypothetical protein
VLLQRQLDAFGRFLNEWNTATEHNWDDSDLYRVNEPLFGEAANVSRFPFNPTYGTERRALTIHAIEETLDFRLQPAS